MMQQKNSDYTAAGFTGCFFPDIFAAQKNKENKEIKRKSKNSKIQHVDIRKKGAKKSSRTERKKVLNDKKEEK